MADTLIESRANPLYRRLLRLVQGGGAQALRAERRGQAAVVLEGVHLCQMWLAHQGAPEHAVFDAQALQHSQEIQALYRAVPRARCVVLAAALAARLSQVGHGPGVYFLAHAPRPLAPTHMSHSALCLDRVQDPGNVGTLLRTAAAAGLTAAYLSRGCAAAWSNKALRAGQGAQFALSIVEQVDLLALCQGSRLPVLATALDDAVSLYDTQLPAQALWLFGHEGQGVDPALLRQASLRLRIPQHCAVESLNVAAAAAICLFEQRRQIARASASGVQHSLP